MTDLDAYIQPLLAADQDFSSAFMLVNRLPEVVTGAGEGSLERVFKACEGVQCAEAYRSQKQAYFLYRAVAQTLQRLVTRNRWDGAAACRRRSLVLMLDRLDADHDGLGRAMAEGVGTLPLAADRRPAEKVVVPPHYFDYFNEAEPGRRLSAEQFREVLARNAGLMGWLMGRGIAHTAPIPLFPRDRRPAPRPCP